MEINPTVSPMDIRFKPYKGGLIPFVSNSSSTKEFQEENDLDGEMNIGYSLEPPEEEISEKAVNGAEEEGGSLPKNQ